MEEYRPAFSSVKRQSSQIEKPGVQPPNRDWLEPEFAETLIHLRGWEDALAGFSRYFALAAMAEHPCPVYMQQLQRGVRGPRQTDKAELIVLPNWERPADVLLRNYP